MIYNVKIPVRSLELPADAQVKRLIKFLESSDFLFFSSLTVLLF